MKRNTFYRRINKYKYLLEKRGWTTTPELHLNMKKQKNWIPIQVFCQLSQRFLLNIKQKRACSYYSLLLKKLVESYAHKN
ncbi:hypothetical protein BLD50_03150 [Bacillus cereus]|nr:hypothetical protein BLD50_03150 [Bacillus cereus]